MSGVFNIFETIWAPCIGGLEYMGRMIILICDITRAISSSSRHTMVKAPALSPARVGVNNDTVVLQMRLCLSCCTKPVVFTLTNANEKCISPTIYFQSHSLFKFNSPWNIHSPFYSYLKPRLTIGWSEPTVPFQTRLLLIRIVCVCVCLYLFIFFHKYCLKK